MSDLLSKGEKQERKFAPSVLVMDDEHFIRDLVGAMLWQLGYSVTTCPNGEEAIEHFRRAMATRKPYSLCIMDLTIYNGMGGVEAAQEILRIDPSAKLVVSSGYSDEPVMAYPMRFGFIARLPKPYTVSELKEVLDSLRS
jgi:two-component system, cell cycle sensor histidine kinase and response regulator CckA